MRKRVFIAHQISGDIQANLESAKQWCRWAIFVKGVNPVAPYLTLMALLEERVEGEREKGLILSSEYIPMCDAFWMCGPVPLANSQVWVELDRAKNLNKPIVDYTGLILPTDFHSVKNTIDPPALFVDKSNLVSPEG